MHDQAAAFWDENQDPEYAELERRGADLERYAAQLEADWAKLKRKRLLPASP